MSLTRVVLVGAGPRGTGLLERLTALAPARLPGRDLQLDVVDPFPFGSGRLWRADQPEVWSLDDTFPLVDGPAVRAWAAANPRVRTPQPGEPLARALVGDYLTWAFWRTVRLAPPRVAVRTYRASAVDLDERGVVLDTGSVLPADVVLLTQGRPGSLPTPDQRARARFADRFGLRYERPRAGDPAALDQVPAGTDVAVRDAGTLTGDLVALLTLGRGGRYADGEYHPTGLEPRLRLLPPEHPPWTDEPRPGDAWPHRRAALTRAGVLTSGHTVRLDVGRRAFVLDDGTAVRTLVEPDIGTGEPRRSDDALLRALAARGELAGWSGTGALLDRTGRAHPRRFAFGPLPGPAGPRGENDAAARRVLDLLAAVPPRRTARATTAIEVRRVPLTDPDVVPMFAELTEEYAARYGHRHDLYALPDGEFDPPHGTLLVLREHGKPIAGGAFRRYDEDTAELKRIWTHTDHRRRGLARRVVAELERVAGELGYRHVYLTTGPRQPEARALYLAAGYTPGFDTAADPESVGPLAFRKNLAIPIYPVGIDEIGETPVRSRP
ncbi:GNAT family N-acetyltransferase [Cryptosporangium arvum]|uniref:GNAT family N-acetyltransferase n=1 Tax=Cryptosporangium arvum TaxID=80871 RepID=UPI0004B26E22|nr:GNAT family N-acetyltransferase [Cryptosporangium arvum]